MRKVLVDAGFHPETGYGSIACIFEDGLPLSRIVQVASSVQGELCAIRDAMEEAASRGFGDEEVIFICDCTPAVVSANRRDHSKNGFIKPIQRALRRHPGWRLEWRPREEVEAAHHLAAITYEAWLEGVRSAETIVAAPTPVIEPSPTRTRRSRRSAPVRVRVGA